jgi:transposase
VKQTHRSFRFPPRLCENVASQLESGGYLRRLTVKRFVESEDRRQGVLLPEYLDDYVSENNPVRVIDVFVDELDLLNVGFEGVVPEATGRPSYHPSTLLKLYIYGYLNQVSSSRRLDGRRSGMSR